MKKAKAFVIGIVILMTLSSLTGCGNVKDLVSESAETQEYHLAAVIGSHANAPRPNLGLIENLVYKACYTYGSVTLVCDDGAPYTLVIDIPTQEDGLSAAKYKEIASDYTKQILTAASQMQAKTDEVDTLKAIQLGARSLNSAQAETEGAELVREMVICDSCLSTTGALSFSEHNLNNIDSENIVSQLKEMDEIPALDGITVTVYTCGDTAGQNQKPLTETNRKALKDVWESILEAGNADVHMKDDLPLSSTYDEDSMPAVSPVTVVQDSVDIHDTEDMDDAFADGGVISFDEKSISFEEGTAEFSDKSAAKESLHYVAEYMNEHPDFELLVCGTTACWGGEEYCMNLSSDRAAAVCQLLADEFGIGQSRLKAAGVGYSFDDFYTYDQTPDGNLDTDVAPVNRSVKLVNMNSDTAVRILSIK